MVLLQYKLNGWPFNCQINSFVGLSYFFDISSLFILELVVRTIDGRQPKTEISDPLLCLPKCCRSGQGNRPFQSRSIISVNLDTADLSHIGPARLSVCHIPPAQGEEHDSGNGVVHQLFWWKNIFITIGFHSIPLLNKLSKTIFS